MTHLLQREVFFWSWIAFVAIKRQDYPGEHNVSSAFAFGALLNLIFESLLYSNHHAKAILFMQIKVTAQKEEQLRLLLDTVPDKVLISTKATESRRPRSLYCNLQTERFFGCNLVKR